MGCVLLLWGMEYSDAAEGLDDGFLAGLDRPEYQIGSNQQGGVPLCVDSLVATAQGVRGGYPVEQGGLGLTPKRSLRGGPWRGQGKTGGKHSGHVGTRLTVLSICVLPCLCSLL